MNELHQEAKILAAGLEAGTDFLCPRFAIIWYKVQDDFEISMESYETIDNLDENYAGIWENFLENDCDSIDIFSSSDDLTFCLQNGYLPGDQIAVFISRPDYYKDYDGDHNIDFDCDVLKVVSGHITLFRTHGLIFDELGFRIGLEEIREKALAEAKADPSKMYLVWDCYFASNQSLWNEMEMPQGISVTLRSRRLAPITYLASGRSDRGKNSDASKMIQAQIAIELPHVTQLFKTLPIRAW